MSKNAVKISRILHAGYVFESQSTKILFDPLFENPFSRNCHAFPAVVFDRKAIEDLRFSAVFISHYHDDHCSFESLDLLDRETPLYLFCLHEELFGWIRQLGFKKVYSLFLNDPVEVGDFKVTPRRALDEDVDSLFHIEVAGLNILNVVDSWIDYETLDLLKKKKPWDMILWPFQTMRELEVIAPKWAGPAERSLPPEWIEQLQILDPKFIVPSSCQFQMESWSWYNRAFFPISYAQFEKEMAVQLPTAKVVRMNPSVSFLLEKNQVSAAEPLPWVQPVGAQDVDYQFDADLLPPRTSEVAKNLPALDRPKALRVLRFCESEILGRYESLENTELEYFSKNRLWKLSVYDHLGKEQNFFYQITNGKVHLSESKEGLLPSWTTEVPLVKLYAALEEGESLTSMYMRVNDGPFDQGTMEQLKYADITEDPLMRCLFTGVFGGYQLAQLGLLSTTTPAR